MDKEKEFKDAEQIIGTRPKDEKVSTPVWGIGKEDLMRKWQQKELNDMFQMPYGLNKSYFVYDVLAIIFIVFILVFILIRI